jgi:outer membrane lipoprotein
VTRALSFLVLAALAGCARPPAALQGTYPPLTVADAQRQAGVGERVRWGGEIVNATPEAAQTCFEIVSKTLDREARPGGGDDSFGRFLACAPGFYDPAIYAVGRDVTVVGAVQPMASGKVGDADYSFAKVQAETVYLWPKRELVRPVAYPYGWGWGYPGWGWGGGVGWGWGGPWYRGRGGYFIGRTVRPGRR